MGLMSKFKNMFTEEIEDEPIKKEVIQVEIPAPTKVEKIEKEEIPEKNELPIHKIESKKIESKEESVPEKKEDKFTFPVFFDDKDFDTIEKPKKEPKIEKKVEPYSGGLEIPKEKPKIFNPTPVISPVFGVLDRNYKKEDITNKVEYVDSPPHDHSMTIDDLRKKAYGTLEDDLENSLVHNDFYEEPNHKSENELFDDFDLLDSGELIPEEKDFNFEDVQVETRESRLSRLSRQTDVEEDLFKSSQKIEEKRKDTEDLFELIDSMYEKGDDEK